MKYIFNNDIIKQHFEARKEKEDVAIIQGLHLVKLGEARGKNFKELDFLIVNFVRI